MLDQQVSLSDWTIEPVPEELYALWVGFAARARTMWECRVVTYVYQMFSRIADVIHGYKYAGYLLSIGSAALAVTYGDSAFASAESVKGYASMTEGILRNDDRLLASSEPWLRSLHWFASWSATHAERLLERATTLCNYYSLPLPESIMNSK